MNLKNAALVLFLVPSLAFAAGCKKDQEETDDVGGGTSEDVSSDEQALVADGNEIQASSSMASDLSAIPTIALSAGGAVSADVAAEKQADAATFFRPAGCLTVSQEANVVTYTFAGCTGPWGLVELNGQEVATFSPGEAEGSIAVALASKDLTANGHAVDHHADVVVTFPGGDRQVSWKGGFTSETDKGVPVAHTSDLVWVVDAEGCRTTNGTTTGSVGDRGVTATYEELTRCGGWATCPAGSISLESDQGLTSSIDFDGTAQAVVTGPRGREWDVPLLCTPM